jgi:YVTN family beta-propeller protein
VSAAGSRSLPSGTVTFLFTDIEGSTRLLQRLGDEYADVLARHQHILRAAFEAHDGHEVDTQGDAFFVAFDRARDAIAAAADAQRALAQHEWPGGVAVNVRMGIHSGDPIASQDGYTGMGVHRAARIGAVDHGGQVLVSSATRELAKDEGFAFKELGSVRLKDLEHPERVHQLVVDGLRNDFPPLRVPPPPVYRRPLVVVTALVLAVMLVTGFLLLQPEPKPVTVRPNSIASIDPKTNKITDQIAVGNGPDRLVSAAGSLWVNNYDDRSVSRVDLEHRRTLKSIPLPETPLSIASAGGAVYVGGQAPGRNYAVVRRIDPQFNHAGDPIKLPSIVPGDGVSLATAGGKLVAAPKNGNLSTLDPVDGHVVRRTDLNSQASDVGLSTNGTIWLPDEEANSVIRIDPSGLVTPIAVGNGPSNVAVADGGVWVIDSVDKSVVRIDPSTNAVANTVKLGGEPTDLAVGAGSVWVPNIELGTVTRIDAKTARVLEVIETGGGPGSVEFAGGRLWVSVSQPIEPPVVDNSDGTLRVSLSYGFGAPDPALPYNTAPWQIFYQMCVKLMNYPPKPGAAGSQLVPEAATAYPEISDDGKTYTFKVRDGFRFSPPSNQPVTAATFKYSLERALSPKTRGPYGQILQTFVGQGKFQAGKAKHISGITASGDTLTLRLTEPSPDLLSKLSLPFACAVPIGTPFDARGVENIPMAGPYYIKASQPNLLLARNPNYHGTRPRGFKQIALRTDVPQKRAVADLLAGRTDYLLDGAAPDQVARLKAKYGKAKTGPHVVTTPAAALSYLIMNPDRPLFHDARMRKAVNYAVDRTELANLGAPNGERKRLPFDGYLPPGMPGYQPADHYPSKPDLAKARALAGSGHRHAVFYNCEQPGCRPIAQALETELAAIGIDIEVKTFSSNQFYARIGKEGEPFDLAFGGWVADYPDPANFLDLLLVHGYDIKLEPPLRDERYLRKLRAAAKLTGRARLLTYGKLANDIARDEAPWAAIGNTEVNDILSGRVGCERVHPIYGLDLGGVCQND